MILLFQVQRQTSHYEQLEDGINKVKIKLVANAYSNTYLGVISSWVTISYSMQNDNYNRLQFFVQDQVYWAPATTASGLYTQLASKKYREINRNQIRY